MYIHDISDIPIDVLVCAVLYFFCSIRTNLFFLRVVLTHQKLVNFLKLEGPQGFFAIEIAYVTALLFWLYYRIYELPFRVIYTAIFLSFHLCAPMPRIYDGLDGFFPPDMPLWIESTVLLSILLVLHLYWLYLLVCVGYRIITESVAQASREEYEGESDVDDEASALPARGDHSLAEAKMK